MADHRAHGQAGTYGVGRLDPARRGAGRHRVGPKAPATSAAAPARRFGVGTAVLFCGLAAAGGALLISPAVSIADHGPVLSHAAIGMPTASIAVGAVQSGTGVIPLSTESGSVHRIADSDRGAPDPSTAQRASAAGAGTGGVRPTLAALLFLFGGAAAAAASRATRVVGYRRGGRHR